MRHGGHRGSHRSGHKGQQGQQGENRARALLARQEQTSAPAPQSDESGAFDIGGFLKGLLKDFTGIQLKREDLFEELLARADADATESGAFDIGGFFKGLLKDFTGIQLKRDDIVDELFAREEDDEEEGSIGYSLGRRGSR